MILNHVVDEAFLLLYDHQARILGIFHSLSSQFAGYFLASLTRDEYSSSTTGVGLDPALALVLEVACLKPFSKSDPTNHRDYFQRSDT